MAVSIAMRGSNLLADRSAQAFSQIVDTIKSVKWNLVGVDITPVNTITSAKRASGWGTTVLDSQEISKSKNLMTKIVLNARDQNGEYYIPPVVSSSSVGDLAWLLSCLGEYPHAMWSESGFMAACEAFLSTDSAQAERSSREAAFTYLATYVADAIYEFLIDPENASGPGLETSKILMSINGEVQVIDLRGAGRLTPMMANEQPVHVLAAATVPVRSSIGLQPGAVDPDLLKAIPELSLLSVLAGGTQRQ